MCLEWHNVIHQYYRNIIFLKWPKYHVGGGSDIGLDVLPTAQVLVSVYLLVNCIIFLEIENFHLLFFVSFSLDPEFAISQNKPVLIIDWLKKYRRKTERGFFCLFFVLSNLDSSFLP